MSKLSRFTHAFELEEHVALWHSLRMVPVFLTKEDYTKLQHGACSTNIEQELLDKKILLSYDNEDQDIIGRLREEASQPAISLCYFILSEKCNLACKYCFLGNNSERRNKFTSQDMSRETADKAIAFFIKQLQLSGIDFNENKAQLIFFGGEPLINFDTLVYVAKKINDLKPTIPLLNSVEMTVITNGTLLTRERIADLKGLGVSINISIDGATPEANEMRVDLSGHQVFDRLISALDLCEEMNMRPSLSVTLSEKTIEDLPSLLKLIKRYEIAGLGYNIMLCSDAYQPSIEYYEKASRFILDSFKEFRPLGIYEDRMMRKLNSFANSQIYYSDCGATAGGQIVFSPSGKVGICHELLAEKENFVTNVNDENFNAKEHPIWQKWASLTPINCDECLDCEALGICGGGCPVNARMANPSKGLHPIDERSCIHAKSTLRFLIEDLYDIVRQQAATKQTDAEQISAS